MPDMPENAPATHPINQMPGLNGVRSVTVDVYVNYHGIAPSGNGFSGDGDDEEQFTRRVIDAIRRETDRTVVI